MLQRSAGNAAVAAALAKTPEPPSVHQQRPLALQRAIVIGTDALPRNGAIPAGAMRTLDDEGVVDEFERLNGERDRIYYFTSSAHLLRYLKSVKSDPSKPEDPPLVRTLTPAEVEEGHKRAQDIRFSGIYEPSTQQLPASAPGAHAIPATMLPPAGTGHHWGQSSQTIGGPLSYVIYANKLTAPMPTTPLTFGDPAKPSLTMFQNGINVGMHIQPTSAAKFLDPISRSEVTYGGLHSVSGRVRGHPLALKNNQISTDGPTTMDEDPRTYTDESDSTKPLGGLSSWRYNEIEKPAINAGTAFTQINEDPVPAQNPVAGQNPLLGAMGVVQPRSIAIRRELPGGGHEDVRMDNTGTTNYRDSLPLKKRRQRWMSEQGLAAAQTQPYGAPALHQPGQDFDDLSAPSFGGYRYPPPTPFLSNSTLMEADEVVTVPGRHHMHSRVMVGGADCIVIEVIRHDFAQNETECRVERVPKTMDPNFS